jgi:lycopene beta-cyclase
MTYFGFLIRFLLVPILALAVLAWYDQRRGRELPHRLRAYSPAWVIAILVLVAVIYTTPWDNYLVATGVWWYDPALVTGILLGWVPIEEYTFFILETVLVGLWTLALARRLRPPEGPAPDRSRARRMAVLVLAPFWLGSVGILLTGWGPGTYLALLLGWALPPLGLQLAFGADILWHHRRLVAAAILAPALYLSGADALALGAGTWTINPEQSLHLLIGGVLPVEELVFFLMTAQLIVVGTVLALAEEGRERLAAFSRSARSFLRSLPLPAVGIPGSGRPKAGQTEE